MYHLVIIILIKYKYKINLYIVNGNINSKLIFKFTVRKRGSGNEWRIRIGIGKRIA